MTKLNNTIQRRFVGAESSFEDADVVAFGAPFDGTVTFRAGSRFAPSAIRAESYGVEWYSPYLDLDLADSRVFDGGDIDIPFGNTKRALDLIYQTTKQIVSANKKPLMLGGEHLVTLPAFQAVFEAHPDVCVIHFDAHTDLREHFGGEALNHATVLRKVWDFIGDGRLFQFGIRSGIKEEFVWAKQHCHLELFEANTLPQALQQIGQRPVYLTIDMDVLDSSVVPGTGTPEAGGMSYRELIHALMQLRGMNLVGADIVELAPHYDISGGSTAVACKLYREVTLLLTQK